MKLLIKRTITSKQADELILKYYEGETTGTEEELFRSFLKQKNLPQKYDVEKAIFGYFAPKSTEKTPSVRFRPLYRSAAAAVIVVLIGFAVYKNTPENKSFAYVDGKKITNIEHIESLAKNSLGEVSSENENVVEEQLSQFSGIGF
ncbi:MAG: hypothetical protein QM751_11225 [Paludibacteraceae bacterium]